MSTIFPQCTLSLSFFPAAIEQFWRECDAVSVHFLSTITLPNTKLTQSGAALRMVPYNLKLPETRNKLRVTYGNFFQSEDMKQPKLFSRFPSLFLLPSDGFDDGIPL